MPMSFSIKSTESGKSKSSSKQGSANEDSLGKLSAFDIGAHTPATSSEFLTDECIEFYPVQGAEKAPSECGESGMSNHLSVDPNDRTVENGTLLESSGNADTHYDRRGEVDDIGEARITFPPAENLYGREKEMQLLTEVYEGFLESAQSRVVFVAGYSGSGKSSLVKTFAHQSKAPCLSGKFTDYGDPFSAIQQALGSIPIDSTLIPHLVEADITIGSELTQVLSDTLLPSLKGALLAFRQQSDRRLLVEDSKADESLVEKTARDRESSLSSVQSTSVSTATSFSDRLHETRTLSGSRTTSSSLRSLSLTCRYDLQMIQFAAKAFLTAVVAAKGKPLIVFLDDMQWAGEASLQLMKRLVTDSGSSLENVLLVVAYRSNIVTQELQDWIDHFENHMNDIAKERVKESAKLFTTIEVANLSPDNISRFIADSLELSLEETRPIVQAVYTKTLGNIFFVKQAMEELVRKNALYYDLMCFQWRFRSHLKQSKLVQEYLSNDLLEMVHSKLQILPRTLQKIILLAAYGTQNVFDFQILKHLLKSVESIELSTDSLFQYMTAAFEQGLLLRAEHGIRSFSFAHDKIREAAGKLLSSDDERHYYVHKISIALLEFHYSHCQNSQNNDMQHEILFTAARHLNSIPSSLVTNVIQHAELNAKVGLIAISKGAFAEAVVFLRQGIQRLDPSWRYKDHYYGLTLKLLTNLVETEHTLGHEELALIWCREIFKHGKSLTDKCRAQCVYIESMCAKNHQDYNISANAGIEILAHYGFQVPKKPSKAIVQIEKMRFRGTLRGRSLASCLASFPIATDQSFLSLMKFAQICLTHVNFAKRSNLAKIIAYRILRLAVAKKAVSKDLNNVAVYLGGPLRQEEKYQQAAEFANVAVQLMDRFPEERGKEYVKSKFIMMGTIACLKMKFRDATDEFFQLFKSLISRGENEFGLAAGMLSIYSHYNSGAPLTSMEPKLLVFEEYASNIAKQTFVDVFALQRQCLYNLKGTKDKCCSSPAVVDGAAFDEAARISKAEGAVLKMTARDIAIFRLSLAVLFGDEEVMDEMLNRLDEYSVYDLPIERQHMRLQYSGFAALLLLKGERGNALHRKWSKICLSFFRNLARFGSPNAKPVYLCLKALSSPSLPAFEEAIQECEELSLLHLNAFMNEQCARYMIAAREKGGKEFENQSLIFHLSYVEKALYAFREWGAKAKVEALQSEFQVTLDCKKKGMGYRDMHSQHHLTFDSKNASVKSLFARQTTKQRYLQPLSMFK